MKVASVDFKVCADANCSTCPAVKACDRRIIIKLDQDEPAFVDRALCNGCGDCLPACSFSAVALVDG